MQADNYKVKRADNKTEPMVGPASPLYEKTLNTTTAFRGRALTVDVIDIELPDGRRSKRECVRHRGAVAILARRQDGAFVFARQYRKCIERAYIEVPAGCMEEGEAPDVAAERELREETGYLVESMMPLGSTFACPGYSEELLHLFFANLTEKPGSTDFDPDENIELLVFDKATVENLILDGSISDAKTLACWLLATMRKLV